METIIIKQTRNRTCDFCRAEEGKLRPVGRFKVELKPVEVFGTKKLACQSCIHKHHAIIASRRERQHIELREHRTSTFRKFISMVVHTCFLIVVLSGVLAAQPPGLPGNPSQAPIDGGLGLLAAAGGAYALKKLKQKKE